jgi:hypothetical protein
MTARTPHSGSGTSPLRAALGAGIGIAVLALAGCAPTGPRLTFPTEPVRAEAGVRHYDTDGDGRADFAVTCPDGGRVESLSYDDDQDGRYDRSYRLDDYDSARVPHLIILLDSIPYEPIAVAHAQGRLSCFHAPQKVIPPFPTMSGLIFSQLLGAPPPPGMINRHYDRQRGRVENKIVKRAFGWTYPWQLRLHYHPNYWENGQMFLKPRAWYAAELGRIPRVLDESPDRITIVYLASTSGLLSKYGLDCLDEIIDQLDQLCLQLLYERNGALKISVISDHGHNDAPPQRISLDETLRAAGFRPASKLKGDRDVVYDIDGLVGYLGIHTHRPRDVAAAVLTRPEIELAMYMEDDRIIVRSRDGAAAVERRGSRFRYRPIDADVLEYEGVVTELAGQGALDSAGFAEDRRWFEATVDHEWPDAPRRLWDAFHGTAINTPDVMFTIRDGYCIGLGAFDFFVDMASTHGGLNQRNSAAIAMSMTPRLDGPLRTRDVLGVLEPEYDPSFRPSDE